jgi:ABC-type transporter Mla subunit MlaD
MNPQVKRWVGLFLVIISAVSLAISAAGLLGLWATRHNIVVADTATLFSDTLTTTDEALTVAQRTLNDVHASFGSLIGTVQAIATALRDGQPAVKSVVQLMQQDLPATIDAAHTAISSAAQTAKGVDDLLNQLARVPLINLDYRPSQPLADSIAGIGVTLSDLPTKLQDMASNLETLNGDLTMVANQVDGMGVMIKQIDSNLGDMQGVLSAYQAQLARAKPALESVVTGADRIITATLMMLTFVMIWIIVVQIITLGIGLRWWNVKRDAS